MLSRFFKGLWFFVKTHKILGAVLLLYGSAILVAAFGKALRVRDYLAHGMENVTFWEYVDIFRPEIFGGLGLIFVVLSMTTLSSRLLVPFIISYTLWIFVCLFEIVGAIYFTATSDTSLDLSIMLYAIGNFEELLPVFANAHGVMKVAAIAAPIIILGIFLLSLYLKISGERQCPWLNRNRYAYALLPVAAVVCLYISFLPNSSIDDKGHTQTFTYNILSSITDFTEASSLRDVPAGEELFPIRNTLSKAPDFDGRNLVVVVLESTSMAATSLGNPEIGTTPYLVELAADSELYTQAYTIVPHTSKAIQGILCGIEPSISHWLTEAREETGIPTDCLARMLAGQGYRTAFFQTATEEFEERRGLVNNMGYDDFYPLEAVKDPGSYQRANYFGLEDDAMLPMSEEWLGEHGEKPFFATYLTLTPHHNYLQPDRYGLNDYVADDEQNRYLNSVWYLDHFIRNLINQYKALGLYDNTLFVIVGDHGEGFGEHGRKYHDTVIYNEGVQVPLIIHDPQAEPGVMPEATSVLDIMPTTLDKLGFTFETESQRGFRYGERNGAPVFTHCARVRSCMSIVKDGYKLVHHFGIKGDELFRLEDDPGELNNLIDAESEMAAAMLEEMDAWRSDILTQYRNYFIGI